MKKRYHLSVFVALAAAVATFVGAVTSQAVTCQETGVTFGIAGIDRTVRGNGVGQCLGSGTTRGTIDSVISGVNRTLFTNNINALVMQARAFNNNAVEQCTTPADRTPDGTATQASCGPTATNYQWILTYF